MRLTSVLIVLFSVSAVKGGLQEWSPTVGVKVTTPQKLSVSIGFCSIPWNGLWGGAGVGF